ncbi:hypothetical protein [Corynebacterium freiburgense]|uniref:hypothetical protein n=1 Tax=Corynebacterium freiburgense TaxID=556548 RepID=UPI0003FE657D|nr:hypothetical protein [Corynebacterium freiburgense]WJZ01436.1 hypothetical protein CFREI_00630 [Corynebacterium freiburgense]
MSSGDKSPIEPDLSLPLGALDQGVWTRILQDAFEMSEHEIDASIVPDFDEAAEIELADDDFGEFILDDDLVDEPSFETEPHDTDSVGDRLFEDNENEIQDFEELTGLDLGEIDSVSDDSFDFE